jgi:hypothetical protein
VPAKSQQTLVSEIQATAGLASTVFNIPIARGDCCGITLSVLAWDGTATHKGFVKQDLVACNIGGVVSVNVSLTNLLLSGIVDAALAGIACFITTTTDNVVCTCTGVAAANPLWWGIQSVFRAMIVTP